MTRTPASLTRAGSGRAGARALTAGPGPAPSTRRRRARIAAQVLAAATATLTGTALLVAGAPQASAHAQVSSYSPADGTIDKRPPRQLVVRFNEQVSVDLDNVQLLDAGGRPVAVTASLQPGPVTAVQVRPQRPLGKGRYVLRWAAISADAHPVSGAMALCACTPSAAAARESTVALQPAGTALVRTWPDGRVELTWPSTARSGQVQAYSPQLGTSLTWRLSGDGKTARAGGLVPWPGTWAITISARTGAFTEAVLTGSITAR